MVNAAHTGQNGWTSRIRSELTRGFPGLVFGDSEIESRFRRDYFQAGVRYRILMLALGIVILVATVVPQTLLSVPPEVRDVSLPLQLFVILPALAISLVITAARGLQRYSGFAIFATGILIGLAVMRMRIVAHGADYDVPMEYIAVIVVSAGFLGRMRGRKLLVLALLLVLILVGGEVLYLPADLEDFYRVGANLTLIAMSCIGTYAYEHAMRLNWLNATLLEQLSTQDPLTGLPNRRALETALRQHLRHATRHQCVIGLAIVDLDYFKLYNDNYGHLAGDDCLRQVAEVLQKSARRPLDCCGRFGGEEFVVAWIGNDPAEMQSMAELLLDRVRALDIRHGITPAADSITASAGLFTIIPDKSTSLEYVMEMADRMLYAAKAAGRDRVVTE
ncbi:GGDEF domain-containing protein [Salinisphaera sp. P385]|uniref:diguanylate cyclase n=1 Tax=Spectribacter acetivorans TaxID=3075603 RepID=A0ABU3B9Z0_9GAMM|nr:GGDEF domain-containing protein [Salinisphaera sp. P385]MDT0619296.1 GGDEF domain-containing protein [Salinisphaera sp. P385]